MCNAVLGFQQARIWLGEVCTSFTNEQYEAERVEKTDWTFSQIKPQLVSYWTEKSYKPAGQALLLKHHQRAAKLWS